MKRNTWRIYGDSSYVSGRRFGSRLGYARPAIDALIQGILSYNPIAYWPLNDAVGSTTVKDVSGNGFTGNVSGTLSLGSNGMTNYGETCCQFTAAGGIITVPNFPGTEAYSHVVIYQDTLGASGGYATIFSTELLSFARSSIQLWVGFSGGGGSYSFPINTAINIYAETYANLSQNSYINGSFFRGMAISNAKIESGTLQLGSTSLQGKIGHLAIFDRALSQAEITAIYQLITATPTLVPFNGNDASIGVINPSNLGVIMGKAVSGNNMDWIQSNLPANSTRVSNGAGLIVNGEMLTNAGSGEYGVMPVPPQSQLVPLGDGVYPPAQNNTCFLRIA